LFNTLNAISVLIQENPKAANTMLVQLSDLLRMTLENVGTHEVPLKREMEFLDRYLQIQQTRFGDRLTVRRQIEPQVTEAFVPYLILQPLVENALRHGIGSLPGPGTVEISALRNNGMLNLKVRDTGPGILHPANSSQGLGIGLTNTQARLQQLYGDQHRLEIENVPDGGLQVSITLPYHLAPLFQEMPDHD
jgi:sensor histidine kinase YesM